jgi:hypothetical protein
VQPLREYFAAKFLYTTAPYSPPGRETVGTLPDRFDAIARNFYWLNVCRFFAGCFDKGDLPTLADRLIALGDDGDYGLISHPRLLGEMLLSDHVFNQHPRSLRAVVDFQVANDHARQIIGEETEARALSQLFVPDLGGRRAIVEWAVGRLSGEVGADYARELSLLIRANTDIDDRTDLWDRAIAKLKGVDRRRWLLFGDWMGVLRSADDDTLLQLNLDDDGQALAVLLNAGRRDFVEHSPRRVEALVDHVLGGNSGEIGRRRSSSSVAMLAIALDPLTYQPVFLGSGSSLRETLVQRRDHPPFDPGEWSAAEHLETVNIVAAQFIELAGERTEFWASDLTNWDRLVEGLRAAWGESRAVRRLAVVSAGVRASSEKGGGCSQLFDSGTSLVQRARYARLRAGGVKWWASQIASSRTTSDRNFALLTLLSWASGKTIGQLNDLLESLVSSLSSREFSELSADVRSVVSAVSRDSDEIDQALSITSPRLATLLVSRLSSRRRAEVFHSALKGYDKSEPAVLNARAREAIRLARDAAQWEYARLATRQAYAAGITTSASLLSHRRVNEGAGEMPTDVARSVLSELDKYPTEFLSRAERVLRLDVAARVEPVHRIAERDNWRI